MIRITEREIDEIQTLKTGRDVCKKYNVRTNGLKIVQDVKDRLHLFLKDQTVEKYQNDGFARRIKDSVAKFKETRIKVITLLQQARQSIFEELEPEFVDIVKACDEHYLENIDKYSRHLCNNECPILVAGEVSAGKSSVINLILGLTILPVGHLHTTNCVCELRYSMVSYLKSYTWNTSNRKLEINQEISCENMSDMATKIQDLMNLTSKNKSLTKRTVNNYSFVRLAANNVGVDETKIPLLSTSTSDDNVEPDDSSELKLSNGKLEIYSDFDFLKDGIFLVDSPGIGETFLATEQVVNYLPGACSIIYIINAENAGGIQEDRLVRLLTEEQNIEKEKFKSFSPESAIFICNKWDNIPIKDRNTVKCSIKQKLKGIWPGFRDSQLILFSSKNASEHYKAGFISDELKDVHGLITNLVEDSLKKNIIDYCSWLHGLLGIVANRYRLLTNCSFFDDNVRSSYLNGKKSDITSAMNMIGDRNIHDDVETIIDEDTDDIASSLFQYFISNKFETEMKNWCLGDIPITEKVTDVKNVVKNLIDDRLIRLLTVWEEDNGHRRKLYDKIRTSLNSHYGQILNKLENLENELEMEDHYSNALSHSSFNSSSKKSKSWRNIYAGVGIVTMTIGGSAAGAAIGLTIADGVAAAVVGGVIGGATGGIGIIISLIVIAVIASYVWSTSSVSREKRKILSIIQNNIPAIISEVATKSRAKEIAQAYTNPIKESIKRWRKQIVKHLRANEVLLDVANQKDCFKIRDVTINKINTISNLRNEINDILKLYDYDV